MALPKSIEEFYARLPSEQQVALKQLRGVILAAMPGAEERLSSGVPFYWHNGTRAVGMGAAKTHLSFFIMHGKVLSEHQGILKPYAVSSTAIRFTPDKPLPKELITQLVKARAAEIDSKQ